MPNVPLTLLFFLAFFDFLAFSLFRFSLLFWPFFLSFPRILGVPQREKPLYFSGFPLLFFFLAGLSFQEKGWVCEILRFSAKFCVLGSVCQLRSVPISAPWNKEIEVLFLSAVWALFGVWLSNALSSKRTTKPYSQPIQPHSRPVQTLIFFWQGNHKKGKDFLCLPNPQNPWEWREKRSKS